MDWESVFLENLKKLKLLELYDITKSFEVIFLKLLCIHDPNKYSELKHVPSNRKDYLERLQKLYRWSRELVQTKHEKWLLLKSEFKLLLENEMKPKSFEFLAVLSSILLEKIALKNQSTSDDCGVNVDGDGKQITDDHPSKAELFGNSTSTDEEKGTSDDCGVDIDGPGKQIIDDHSSKAELFGNSTSTDEEKGTNDDGGVNTDGAGEQLTDDHPSTGLLFGENSFANEEKELFEDTSNEEETKFDSFLNSGGNLTTQDKELFIKEGQPGEDIWPAEPDGDGANKSSYRSPEHASKTAGESNKYKRRLSKYHGHPKRSRAHSFDSVESHTSDKTEPLSSNSALGNMDQETRDHNEPITSNMVSSGNSETRNGQSNDDFASLSDSSETRNGQSDDDFAA